MPRTIHNKKIQQQEKILMKCLKLYSRRAPEHSKVGVTKNVSAKHKINQIDKSYHLSTTQKISKLPLTTDVEKIMKLNSFPTQRNIILIFNV